ncbi:hypothetical protein PMAYCL1PPCAC_09113 [Pristionchus mayeri]|uniref:Uncharacterized protein n=1 Tax=Pristionchus mayeri TaxID=1317129 RepID=A0AAN4ZD11_9BILA|nr:hypothetical protein PMAYCL1PPCAC_09113 [Pristionchus mayeri]
MVYTQPLSSRKFLAAGFALEQPIFPRTAFVLLDSICSSSLGVYLYSSSYQSSIACSSSNISSSSSLISFLISIRPLIVPSTLLQSLFCSGVSSSSIASPLALFIKLTNNDEE